MQKLLLTALFIAIPFSIQCANAQSVDTSCLNGPLDEQSNCLNNLKGDLEGTLNQHHDEIENELHQDDE